MSYDETAGKRKAYEIHHRVPIKHGGGVYDLSNLVILTPKQHVLEHKKREKRHVSRKLEDYTENEFLKFVTDIYEMNTESDREHQEWMGDFAELVQHPRGWDLIFRYIDGIENTPTGIVAYIKKWRAENNLSGFKEN
ncbi:bacteriocin immunity protein [Pseudomonas sp. KNUC1026]|nr:bacteriocin immunity protein [Pseudomonas sp. KNUC1026]